MPIKDAERRKAQKRIYYALHREEVLAKQKCYYANHREQISAQTAVYRALHQVEIKASHKQYYYNHQEEGKTYRATHKAERAAKYATWAANNRERKRAAWVIWYANHREEVLLRATAYAAAHPERIAVIGSRRAARKHGLPDTLTRDQWEAIKTAYNHRCAYCGVKSKRLTQDHVLPLVQGGGTTPDNIVPACKGCNSRKGPRPPINIPPIRLLL